MEGAKQPTRWPVATSMEAQVSVDGHEKENGGSGPPNFPLKAWLVRSGSKLTVLINHLGAGKSHCAESYDKQK